MFLHPLNFPACLTHLSLTHTHAHAARLCSAISRLCVCGRLLNESEQTCPFTRVRDACIRVYLLHNPVRTKASAPASYEWKEPVYVRTNRMIHPAQHTFKLQT